MSGSHGSPDLAEFVEDHAQGLLRFAFLITGGRSSDAEDLVYDVLARLAARGLDGLTDPRAYARTSIMNQYRSSYRRQSVQRRVLGRLAQDRGPTTATTTPEDRITVLAALGDLSERERAAIVLRYYEDLDDTEIASILCCSRSTVRSLVHRAMPKLRSRLDETYRNGPTEVGRKGSDGHGRA